MRMARTAWDDIITSILQKAQLLPVPSFYRVLSFCCDYHGLPCVWHSMLVLLSSCPQCLGPVLPLGHLYHLPDLYPGYHLGLDHFLCHRYQLVLDLAVAASSDFQKTRVFEVLYLSSAKTVISDFPRALEILTLRSNMIFHPSICSSTHPNHDISCADKSATQ